MGISTATEPETIKEIELQPWSDSRPDSKSCGCYPSVIDNRWLTCAYHDGFNDAIREFRGRWPNQQEES